MKTFIIVFFSLASIPGYAQETTYDIPVPKGWGTEKIPFPINFAPAIEYKGVEEIRFMPNWAKKDSADYWSYVFVWHLEGALIFEPGTLEEKMKIYYEGLASATKSVPPEKLIPVVAKFKSDPIPKGQHRDFSGTIEMLDYMQRKKQVLNCKVHSKVCEGKTIVYFELSPQPFTHPLWKELDQVWKEAKCKK